MELSDDGTKYMVTADAFYYPKETSQNHKCPNCGSVLWTAVNNNNRKYNRWAKITDYGWVYRPQLPEYYSATNDDGFVERLRGKIS